MNGIDAIVIGSGTFEKILAFPSWPYDKKAFVLSSSLKQLPGTLKDKATLLSLQPRELLDHLLSLSISGIYVDGGKLIQDFLAEDLIDNLVISKVPMLIGNPKTDNRRICISFLYYNFDTPWSLLQFSNYNLKMEITMTSKMKFNQISPLLLLALAILLLPCYTNSQTKASANVRDTLNIGFVQYTKGSTPGTLYARWNYANIWSGTGIATGGPKEGFAGHYHVRYFL